MQTANFNILSSTASLDGAWFDISNYSSWSLHAYGLETGATITVYLSNEAAVPANAQVDANAYVAQTLTPTNGVAFLQGQYAAKWLQVAKTQGTTPAATTVQLFAQIG